MKIINYSVIFSSFFIISACSSTPSSKTALPDSFRNAIALCSTGYSTEESAGLEAEYNKHHVGFSAKRSSSLKGVVTASSFKGETAAKIYNTYVKCVQSQSNKSRASISIYGDQNPIVNVDGGNKVAGSNTPSTVNITYDN